MNIEARQIDRAAKEKSATKLQIIDGDIHPKSSLEDLRPYLSNRWWDYAMTYGARSHHGYVKGFPYPKGQPLASRRDSWPPDGGLPASNYEFMREQYLDCYGIDFAVMNPLSPSGQGEQNDEYSAALAFAANEFQLNHWNKLDPRLKASLIVPYEDPEASRAEIRKRSGDKRFAHVLMLTRTSELMGRRRYWPIYEAACEAGLPVGVHVFGYSGRAASNTGWPSFYIEEMTEHSNACQAQVVSLIMEGVFEALPQLKMVFIEGGFGWIPALGHRMDRNWKRMRSGLPHLKGKPSEYLHDHFWVTTQPMEEPDNPAHLADIMEAIGFDRILFSSDYPHWDFDDPFVALPASLGKERCEQVYSGNAKALYGLRLTSRRRQTMLGVPSGTEAARAFVPAKDFDLSKAFYEALGFKKLLDGDVAIFGVGASAFILQRYYKKEWAENCMMQMMVDNVDAWWEHIEALELPKVFGVQAPKAPAMQPWGLRVAYVYDPSGVLWHVAERRENTPAD